MSGKKKDMSFLVGKVIGKWEVLSVFRKGTHTMCNCKCVCGVIKNVYYTHMKSGKSLGCVTCAKPTGKNSPYFKGVEDISADWWRSHVYRGSTKRYKNRRGIEVSITKEQAWSKYLEQNKCCALTGLPIEFPLVNSAHGTASLDRIDSSGDYTIDNVQWVHKDINLMKNKLSQERFVELCKQVAKHS